MCAWVVDAITESSSTRGQGGSSPCGATETVGGNFLDTLKIRGDYKVKPRLPFTQGVAILTGEGA